MPESAEFRFKATTAPPPGKNPLDFVLSDESVDRVGDVIEAGGWELDNFKRNPVALFSHNPDWLVGNWHDIRVEKGRLLGRLELLEPVTAMLRHVRAAVEAGVLRAVSVGFVPLDSEPLKGSNNGRRYTKSELVEASLVSVPANPNALAIAKSLGIPAGLIFGEFAGRDRRGTTTGGLAEASRTRVKTMTPTERIEAAQANVNALRDELSSHLERIEDDDADGMAIADQLNEKISAELKKLATFQAAEAALGAAAEPVRQVPASAVTVIPPSHQRGVAPQPRPFALPKRHEPLPGELFGKALTARFVARVRGQPIEQVLAEGGLLDSVPVRALVDWQQRAASNPATTTTTNWAAELAQTETVGYVDALLIQSVYRPLAARGVSVALGRNANITMPMDLATPTISGSFVAEGAPIPVRQGAFTSFTIGLKKMAVITTFTREIAEHSQPTIDPLLRDRIQRDTSVSLDTILLDANPVSSIRPAGIRNGVAGLTPTAGGGFNALVGDITQMMAVLITANSLRAPTWIMNPQQALKISMLQSSSGTGVFPFKAEIEASMLVGYPVIISSTVPTTTVILVDAADFVTTTGDDFRFDLSDQATLHMEDTTPLAIGTAGSPATVAAPTRSLFQTDSIALRMILSINWAMRRSGLVAWVTGVTW